MALCSGRRNNLALTRVCLCSCASDSGKLYIETETEEFVVELVSGVSYTRTKGVKHNVVNQNDHEFVFVEIELN